MAKISSSLKEQYLKTSAADIAIFGYTDGSKNENSKRIILGVCEMSYLLDFFSETVNSKGKIIGKFEIKQDEKILLTKKAYDNGSLTVYPIETLLNAKKEVSKILGVNAKGEQKQANNGWAFEKIIWDMLHLKNYKPDNGKYTNSGDVQINGDEYQIKFFRATIQVYD